METEHEPASPNNDLAELISQALAHDKLIRAERLDEIKTKIAKGSMRAADWRLEIEPPEFGKQGEIRNA